MQDYMPIDPYRFLDINRGLAIVPWFKELRDAEKLVADKEAAYNSAASFLAISGPTLRDELYAFVMAKPASTKTPKEKAEILRGVLERFRDAKNRNAGPVILESIAADLGSVFFTFDEKGFMEAAEETGLMVGGKEAKQAADSARASLASARTKLNNTMNAYKTGIFLPESPIFKLPEAERAEAAVRRAKDFVSAWTNIARHHREPVTAGATAINTLPVEGGLRKTWSDNYALLFTGLPKSNNYFVARKYKAS